MYGNLKVRDDGIIIISHNNLIIYHSTFYFGEIMLLCWKKNFVPKADCMQNWRTVFTDFHCGTMRRQLLSLERGAKSMSCHASDQPSQY